MNKNFDIIIGAIIKAKRKEKKLTQTDLAKMVGTTTQCIYYYETGNRGMTINTFFDICKVLDIDPNEVHKLLK